MEIVEERSSADPTTPDVLVGDFNSVPGSDAVELVLAAGFVDAWAAFGGAECAQPGDGGCSGGPPAGEEVWSASPSRPLSARIDYVFVRPPAGCRLSIADAARIGDVSVPDGERGLLWPSDHAGFVAQPTCAAAPAPAPAPADDHSVSEVAGAEARLPATGGGPVGWLPVAAVLAAWLLAHATRPRPRARGTAQSR